MQDRWIGKSTGVKLHFEINQKTQNIPNKTIEVFTTRPDTLFGASFCAIAPDHPIASILSKENPEIKKFISTCQKQGTTLANISKAEKIGCKTGITVNHPFIKDKELDVYIANFVLMEYGTGAVFGCPAHDQRDLDFANKYQLEVIPVVLPSNQDPIEVANNLKSTGDNDKSYDLVIRKANLNIEDAKNLAADTLSGATYLSARVRKLSPLDLGIGEFQDKDIGVVQFQLYIVKNVGLWRCQKKIFPLPCLMM